MPKRLSKPEFKYQQGFATGFSHGKNLQILSIQINHLRTKKGMAIEEFAKGANVTEDVIVGLEKADLKTYMKMELSQLVQIAKFCDVALSVKIKSHFDNTGDPATIEVPTFKEEQSSVVFGQKTEAPEGSAIEDVIVKAAVEELQANVNIMVSKEYKPLTEEDMRTAIAQRQEDIASELIDGNNTDDAEFARDRFLVNAIFAGVDKKKQEELTVIKQLPQKSFFPEYWMVFDVESVGLHGQGFAVAWVVVNSQGERLEEYCLVYDLEKCKGTDDDKMWVLDNVPDLEINVNSLEELHSNFWHKWLEWKAKGAALVADCSWPVEAKFLEETVSDYPTSRNWEGPLPLFDLSSILLMCGFDPIGIYDRLPDELPRHHSLHDARQSARLLVECIHRYKKLFKD